MKKLHELIKYASSVKILVPSTHKVDQPMSKKEFEAEVDAALIFLGETFGGSTGTDAIGTWVSSQPPSCGSGSRLIKERVKSVEAYTTSDALESSIEAVIEFCEDMKARLGQEAIALIINGELYFI